MTVNKREITATREDGTKFTVIVKRPNSENLRNAQMIANKAARMALDSDAIIRAKLDDVMEKQGLWTPEKKAKLEQLDKALESANRVLLKGGILKSKVRELCLQMRRDRLERTILLSDRNNLDQFTVEAQAENAKFDYLVTQCVVDEEGNPLFKNVDDYKDQAEKDHVAEAAQLLASLFFCYDSDWEKKLPENKVLLDLKFIDDELRLINKDGHLIDKDGLLVNKDGRYIDKDGHFVNKNQERVDEDGNAVTEFTPFLDDDEQKLVEEKTITEVAG